MPILHKYQDKIGWFVRTAIGDSIITFQLTEAGTMRLLEAGIKDGVRFRRAILFDLWKRGDAYTHGTGPGTIAPIVEGQFELDFSNDPEQDTIFSGCSICGSLDELHLVEVRKEADHYLGLYCSDCRNKNGLTIDTSIPLAIVTRGVLEKVKNIKGIAILDRSGLALQKSIEKSFNDKWDKLLKQKILVRAKIQRTLLDVDDKQKKLI